MSSKLNIKYIKHSFQNKLGKCSKSFEMNTIRRFLEHIFVNETMVFYAQFVCNLRFRGNFSFPQTFNEVTKQ